MISSPLRLPVSVVVLATGLSGCFLDTQKYPGMLTPQSNPLPDGAKSAFGRGAEEALIQAQACAQRTLLARLALLLPL